MAIKLSNLARQDLDEIRDYTMTTWGRDQWLKYYRGLVAVFEAISSNTSKGRNRDLFYPGMRSVNYEQHIIFYAAIKSANNKPVILRILHQKRNLLALMYYENLEE